MLDRMKIWVKDFPTGLFRITEIKEVGQKTKLNSSQELCQSMMSIFSGIQTGEETSMNALLRTAHLKEILSWHTNMHFKWTNTLPYWCQNIFFLP